MLRILSLFKWVADEAYVKASASGELDLSFVEYKISDYDKNAIEEAVLLAEKYGGTVAVATVGLPEDTKSIKDALSRGPEKAYFINDADFSGLEPSQTASLLAQAIAGRIEYDLIICGEGSADLYAQQVGPRLADKLGIPCICYVQKIEIQDNTVVAERKTDEGVELVSCPLPLLVSVVPDINTPRIPGLRDTLAAGKKPVVYIEKSELNGDYSPRLQTINARASSIRRNVRKFSPDLSGIKEFVAEMKKLGIV